MHDDATATPDRTGQGNRQIALASRPDGHVDRTNFAVREVEIPTPGPGEALVRTLWLSVDPYVRPLMNDPMLLPTDAIIPGEAVGVVISSRHPLLRPGQHVQGYLGWQEYATAPAVLLRRLDPNIAPVQTALGVLGSSGLTAFFGMFAVGLAKPRETVAITAAAGAVGSAAVQLAKNAGCRVIGITSSDEKRDYLLDELGVDVALNYKNGDEWRSRLGVHTPFGIDVFFDNVGGRVSDAVFRCLAARARVVVCGQVAEYERTPPPPGPRWLGTVLHKSARVEGFHLLAFASRFRHALQYLTATYRAGKLRQRESIAEGLENAPGALIALFESRNIGKQLVKLA
jgi:NADPH:quinone reductase